MTQEYCIERTNNLGISFKLWGVDGDRHTNLATFIFQDPVLGNQWTVSGKERGAVYCGDDARREIRHPLAPIQVDEAMRLLKLTSIADVFEYIEGFNGNNKKP